jgi:cellulose synthase/poly-beta-1,6-N-acetylglucosamine synthase-like glycosyltransferase
MHFITMLLVAFNYAVLVYFLILNMGYLTLTVISYISINKHMRAALLSPELKKLFQSRFFVPISVLAPAYNEEPTICDSVKSLLQIEYPEFEIIVINDGSTDKTFEVLKKRYNLVPSFRPYRHQCPCNEITSVYTSPEYPHLVVINKKNGGKADALNAGINVSWYPLISAIDSDSILEPDVMLKLVKPFMDDPLTIATGGIIRIVNGCKVKAGKVVEIGLPKKWLVNFQIVEYMRSFLFGRVGWSELNALLVISGAFGLFRKDVVIESGGYQANTIGEDMELIIRLHRTMRDKGEPYRIGYIPEPICWTEVPESISVLGNQRNRWQRGLIESMLTHVRMLFNPKYGVIGLCALPFYLVFEMLGPVIEFVGYLVFIYSLSFGLVDMSFAILFLSVSIVLGLILSVSAFVLEELLYGKYPRYSHLVRLLIFSVLENFGYRQVHSYWRFMGIVDFFRGKKAWGKMVRKGVDEAP